MIEVLVEFHLVGGTATDEEEIGIVLGEQFADMLLAPHRRATIIARVRHELTREWTTRPTGHGWAVVPRVRMIETRQTHGRRASRSIELRKEAS